MNRDSEINCGIQIFPQDVSGKISFGIQRKNKQNTAVITLQMKKILNKLHFFKKI